MYACCILSVFKTFTSFLKKFSEKINQHISGSILFYLNNLVDTTVIYNEARLDQNLCLLQNIVTQLVS